MTKKMSKLLPIILILVIVIISVVVAVVLTNTDKTERIDTPEYIFTKTNKKMTLTKFKNPNAKDKVELPREHDGMPITEIDKEAFKGDTAITEVILPDSYRIIGEGAFAGCTNLKTVKMPNVVEVAKDAFNGANSLSDINLPSTLLIIGDRAFSGCSSLRSFDVKFDDKYVVKSNLVEIGEEAFRDTRLSEFYLPGTVNVIGKRAFYKSSLSDLFMYEGIEEIGEESFMDSTTSSLRIYTFDPTKTVEGGVTDDKEMVKMLSNRDTFPSSVRKIGDRAFKKTKGEGGTYYFSDLVFSKNLTSIGKESFSGAHIYSIKFLNPDTTLDAYAFSYMNTNLRVEFPANIKVISEGLFLGSNLIADSYSEPIRVPATVETIGVGAFSGSGNTYKLELAEGSVTADRYAVNSNSNLYFLTSKDGKVLYSVIPKDSYSSSNYTLLESIETIERYALTRAGSTTAKLIIPQSVKVIKADAFLDLKIGDITLRHKGEDTLTIDKGAFRIFNNSEPTSYLIKLDGESMLYSQLVDMYKDSTIVNVNSLVRE